MKQKGVCIDCGLIAAINKTTHRCRMCQSKKEGSDWLPSEERSFKQRMIWRYSEMKNNKKNSGDFPQWNRLERFCINDHKPKRIERELIKVAKEWLPYELFRDGSGLCWAEAPFGKYGWHFCVAMEQERIWDFKEFQEGLEFGKNPKEPFRDTNPYNERSRYRNWDCGYIFGLEEKV